MPQTWCIRPWILWRNITTWTGVRVIVAHRSNSTSLWNLWSAQDSICLAGSQFHLPHTFIHMWTELSCRTSQPQRMTALWLVLVCHTAEGRRLSCTGWLGKDTIVVCPPKLALIPVLTGPDIQQRWQHDQWCYHYLWWQWWSKLHTVHSATKCRNRDG